MRFTIRIAFVLFLGLRNDQCLLFKQFILWMKSICIINKGYYSFILWVNTIKIFEIIKESAYITYRTTFLGEYVFSGSLILQILHWHMMIHPKYRTTNVFILFTYLLDTKSMFLVDHFISFRNVFAKFYYHKKYY